MRLQKFLYVRNGVCGPYRRKIEPMRWGRRNFQYFLSLLNPQFIRAHFDFAVGAKSPFLPDDYSLSSDDVPLTTHFFQVPPVFFINISSRQTVFIVSKFFSNSDIVFYPEIFSEFHQFFSICSIFSGSFSGYAI
jgi:hypothetical protein